MLPCAINSASAIDTKATAHHIADFNCFARTLGLRGGRYQASHQLLSVWIARWKEGCHGFNAALMTYELTRWRYKSRNQRSAVWDARRGADIWSDAEWPR
jgi:hypothetical protein